MTDYYLSAAGDDADPGTSSAPWQTIGRLNTALSSGIGLGDRVFLRRGDTFYGRLRPSKTLDANASGWLNIGAYGDGDRPAVSSWLILNTSSGWVQHDADTWKLDYSAANSGVTYTGYGGGQGDHYNEADVALLMVDGVVYNTKHPAVADLVDQWDYCSIGTVLYVRSTADPTTLAADIRCTIDGEIIQVGSATELTDVHFTGAGANGIIIATGTGAIRSRVLGCEVSYIGGSYAEDHPVPETRYGNGITVWNRSKDIYCERNTVHDIFDAAFSPQYGTAGETDNQIENVTWRRNLVYRCAQSEEYSYLGAHPQGFINIVSEYNTNLFAGFGPCFGPRPEPQYAVHVLSYNWGDNWDIAADVTLRRNIYYDGRGGFSFYSIAGEPTGLTSDRNVILMRPGTLMRASHDLQTIEDAAAWAAAVGRDGTSLFGVLPARADVNVADADVTAAIASLDELAPAGQLVGNKLVPIHAVWR